MTQTPPADRPYTRAEKLAILTEARATAALLLEKLELLTQIGPDDDPPDGEQ